jgi:hypothetical protein
MTDNKQLQQVHEASWEVVDSIRETNQMVADSLVTIQDRNLKFAQNIFLSWMELFTGQTESIQHWQEQWGQQARTQRDAFQKLASTSTQIYRDLLLAPFAFSRRLVDATEEAMQQEQASARKAARSEQGKS